MLSRTVGLLLVLFTAATTFGNDADEGSYSALKRFHQAMQVASFPSPAPGKICLWMQETPTEGRLRIADINQWPASATAKFFDAHRIRHDFRTIAIISNNGKSIRFVDPRNEDVNASRGDVVVILLSEKAK